MFVSAGVRKLSDADSAIVEINSVSSNFVFTLLSYTAESRAGSYGSTGAPGTYGNIGATVSAPLTRVVAHSYSANGTSASDFISPRVNGAVSSYTPQVTAAASGRVYSNSPIYIGARGGSSLWFNGRLYGLIVAGKLANAVEITETEKYVNGKTAALDWRDVTDSSSFRWNSATASPDAS